MKNALLGVLARARLLGPAYRVYETLKSVRAPSAVRAPDGLPLPPRRLIVRVAGTVDVEWFLNSGRLAAGSIRAALWRQGRRIEDLAAILDFGCGCGRVTRNWIRLPETNVYGSDANEKAVEWCRRNLPFARFEANGLAPPLVFEDAWFDLVYALSVFTHLPEQLQILWLRELSRVLKPGGYLFLTTHGEWYLPRLSRKERDDFAAGRIVVRREQAAGTNLCTAFHPPAALRRLASDFELLEFLPEGAKGNPHQDLSLLRKP